MSQVISISEFLPTISTEQRHKIRELSQAYQDYIDSILKDEAYSFVDYLCDIQLSDLCDFYDELDEVGIGFGCSAKTEIIGCKEITLGDASERIQYKWFTLVE